MKILINILIFILIAGFVFFVVRSFRSNPTILSSTTEESSAMESVWDFVTTEPIVAIDISDALYLATDSAIEIRTADQGALIHRFAVEPGVRDIALDSNLLYLLYPNSIVCYDNNGTKRSSWMACSDNSSFVAIATSADQIYVSDAANKNIHRYLSNGDFRGFITSPEGFIVPSLVFDLALHGDTLVAVNPGRHQLEFFTTDGEFIHKKGGDFVGCCNPSYLTIDSRGKIFTSEKGTSRVRCFGNPTNLISEKGNEPQKIVTDDQFIYSAVGKRVKKMKFCSSPCDSCPARCK